MKIKLTLLFFFFMQLMIFAQRKCTDILILAPDYLDVRDFYEDIYSDATLGHNNITLSTSFEYNSFRHSLAYDSIKNKKVNYLFETNKDLNNKLFKDFRKEYFRYNPVNADTLAGKLVETYQKYNDILNIVLLIK